MPAFRLLLGLVLLCPATLLAESIQRCQAADGSITYSNEQCPKGSRPVRALAPPVQPTADDQSAARERAQRDRSTAKSLATARQPSVTSRGEPAVPLEDARRAVDCAYLRGELDASRRLRNVLTTRPYYSQDDVEQMDARNATLAADYQRFCTR